ncbi:ABC transporter ATP-binding protein [Helicovermis profundi]|uniref:ATP-binding cassette domain-containing protein n=1 Tax=Helicovermis profundi TaxID=3065157 RepID=A0AAU9E1Z4_9FIRM|nr:ATP-binding cassette domain-containing protein [Clostridia bacterium S502]
MINVNNLEKVYKLSKKQMKKEKLNLNIKKAVNGISFNVGKGEIYGLLGPNGAGKTTTLRCISTLIKPTNGNIKIRDFDVIDDSRDVRKNISFLTNELKLDGFFTPNYTFEYFGKLYGMDDKQINDRKIKLFHYFGITEFKDVKISDLSTGMKQKLSIAVSLVHDPEIIIFDEPTNGLDIVTAKVVVDYLKYLKKQGKTIIVSTHIMSVASKLCDRMGIIIDGRIVIDGTLKEILLKTNTEDLEDAFFSLYLKSKEGEKNE